MRTTNEHFYIFIHGDLLIGPLLNTKWLYLHHSRSVTIYFAVTRKHLYTWRNPSEEILKGTGVKAARKRAQNIPVSQAVFSLPQQIYTVVGDGPGFLLKLSPPIINSMAADTARHLHGSDTAGLFPGTGRAAVVEVGAGRLVGSGAHRPFFFFMTWVVL